MLPINVSKFLRKKALQYSFLPQHPRICAERWLRGNEEYKKLMLADAAVVSYEKSGRTWLRVMLSCFYRKRYQISQDILLNFNNLQKLERSIPAILFTHDRHINDYTGNHYSKRDFYSNKVILLVRDPRDVAVSTYFQWKYRMNPKKKLVDRFPPHGTDISIFDFVMRPESGLPAVINYMNLWRQEINNMENLLVIRYEDLKSNTEQLLKQVIETLGDQPTDEEITEAVKYASFDKMKEREKNGQYMDSRIAPADRANPDSFKARRAKIGGYRDYFDSEQIHEIDQLLDTQLDRAYGYG